MTERLNIRRMQAPEDGKESGLFFETPAFTEMKTALDAKVADAQRPFAAEHWTDTAVIAASIATMYPNKRPELYLEAQTWRKIETHLNKLVEENDFGNYISLMRYIVMFRPSARPVGDTKEKCLARVADNIQHARQRTGNMHSLRHTASTAKLLFPDYVPDITEEEWGQITDDVKKERRKAQRSNHILYLNSAADIKIMAPERAEPLTPKEQSMVSDDLDRHHAQKDLFVHHEGARHYAEEMISAKILAAEKVEITEEGLKFKLPGQYNDKPSQPPETLEV